jgi:hypothetical protein
LPSISEVSESGAADTESGANRAKVQGLNRSFGQDRKARKCVDPLPNLSSGSDAPEVENEDLTSEDGVGVSVSSVVPSILKCKRSVVKPNPSGSSSF